MATKQALEPLQVSAKDAATMLGYSLRRFNDLVYSGEIPAVKSGKMRRFSIEALKRWQQENMS